MKYLLLIFLAEQTSTMALLTITDNDAHMQHFLYRIAFGHEQQQRAKQFEHHDPPF